MPKSTLPDEYAALLNDLKCRIRQSKRGVSDHMTNSITSNYPRKTNEPLRYFGDIAWKPGDEASLNFGGG